ncbi:ClpP/crotonase-like domain-containing protein [Penicillium angulare]|uniref:ClpP/crotonase-like domain-containing protein n=1 Tax=Penicillium angulare TaxID=116970 RepID=A0A9W9ETY8_9EURO|nr:ClpP/crotonase-like domain-containing protein [Penicillium angulare]
MRYLCSSLHILASQLPLSLVQQRAALCPEQPAPELSGHGTMSFTYPSSNVTRVTINNGPVNFVDRLFADDLLDFLIPLQNVTEDTPKVVIFDSSNPNFWLGHIDMRTLATPITNEKKQLGADYMKFTQLLQNITSTVFIAEIDGRAFGAGNEIAAQMDMRFVGPRARTGSFEEALGLIAGGGGQTYMGAVLGKAKAMEYLLAAKSFTGPAGEALGLYNKYYDDSQVLKDSVLELAQRIALFPRVALNQTKSVLSFLNPPNNAFQLDFEAFYDIEQGPEQQANVRKFIELSEDQAANHYELGLGESVMALYGLWDGSVA